MKLILGDCLDKMKDIPDQSVDMCLTDPPYGTTACKWDCIIPFEPMWKELKRIVKPNGAICLFGSEPFSSHLRLSNLKMFKYDWIWVKNKTTGAMVCKYRPMNAHEIISVFGHKTQYYPQKTVRTENELKRLSRNSSMNKKSEVFGGGIGTQKRESMRLRHPDTAVHFDCVFSRSKEKVAHPTQKPVPLLEYLIKTYTLENETVLDFTMGSGSAGVACKNLNRHFIGIEKDEKYFEIAKKRIEDHKTQTELGINL